MKKLAFLLLALFPLPAVTGVETFSVDYFGFPLTVECQVEPSGLSTSSFEQTVSANQLEVEDCVKSLLRVSAQYQIRGYAQALLFARFVEGLPAGYDDSGFVSFARAALGQGELSRESRLALLYVMLSQAGYETAANQDDDHYFLLLKLGDRVKGWSWGKDHDYYVWEPGRPFEEVEAIGEFSGSRNTLYHPGRTMTFNHLPALPWPETGRGDELVFKSPPGCPAALNFSVERLPNFERFLALWPRDKVVMARLARQMFAPFGFERQLKAAAAGMDQVQLANCLIRWVQMNAPYDFEHSAEWRPDRMRRNPVETLFIYRSGICDEMSLTLVGMLRHSGFAADRIRLVIWKREGEVKHMNLAVRAEGASPGGKYLTEAGQKFFIMDPAYYNYDQGRLVTSWGQMADGYEEPALYPVSEKSK